MKNRKKKFHLAQFLVHGPTYHSLAMWRHPRTEWPDDSWFRPELYQHIAQVCERGPFDTVFFADLNYVSDSYKGSLEPALRYATQAPEHDLIPLLTMMAAVTSRIGPRCHLLHQLPTPVLCGPSLGHSRPPDGWKGSLGRGHRSIRTRPPTMARPLSTPLD